MTEHFSLAELCSSRKALELNISNQPTPLIIKQLHFTAVGLERIRAVLGFPIRIDSGYRNAALNKAVGGQPNSQHLRGEAADIVCPAFGLPRQVAKYLETKTKILGIDQLILEGTWVHVSFTLEPRGQALTRLGEHYVVGII